MPKVYISESGQIRTFRMVDNEGNEVGWGDELVPPLQATNITTMRDRARAALATNATYLAKATTTTADDKAQIKALTRECSALIRLALDLTDTIDGT